MFELVDGRRRFVSPYISHVFKGACQFRVRVRVGIGREGVRVYVPF